MEQFADSSSSKRSVEASSGDNDVGPSNGKKQKNENAIDDGTEGGSGDGDDEIAHGPDDNTPGGSLYRNSSAQSAANHNEENADVTLQEGGAVMNIDASHDNDGSVTVMNVDGSQQDGATSNNSLTPYHESAKEGATSTSHVKAGSNKDLAAAPPVHPIPPFGSQVLDMKYIKSVIGAGDKELPQSDLKRLDPKRLPNFYLSGQAEAAEFTHNVHSLEEVRKTLVKAQEDLVGDNVSPSSWAMAASAA